MYKSSVLVAVNNSADAETVCGLFSKHFGTYTSVYKDGLYYIELEEVSWNPDHDPMIDYIMTRIMEMDNPLYVCMGEDFGDNTVIGNIQDYLVTLKRGISY